MSDSQLVKEKLQKYRDKETHAKEQEDLSEELGPGVEAEPIEVESVDLDNIPDLDLSSADDVRQIFDELQQLPSIKEVGDQLKKHDAYQLYARKIWKIKQSEKEVFDIKCRVIEKTENIQRGDVTIKKHTWKRDKKDGGILIQKIKFRYSSVTIQEKDEFLWLEAEKQDAHFAVIEEGARVDKIIQNTTADSHGYEDYSKNKTWQDKYMKWQHAVQEYWISIFKSYYGATDQQIETILFDDIVNYAEVALYKGGVKSPK